MSQLLNVSLDNNKHAQAAAIAAFGHLAKEAGPTGALAPYLQSIAQAFVAAFHRYQSKNILKLYEAIGHLSDGVGPSGLNDPQVLDALMPPLIERWQTFADDDINLLHLLGVSSKTFLPKSTVLNANCPFQCLTSLIVAAGSGFKKYADPGKFDISSSFIAYSLIDIRAYSLRSSLPYHAQRAIPISNLPERSEQ